MSFLPLDVVRAAERRIADRSRSAAQSTAAVTAAAADAEARIAAARLEATERATARSREITAVARRDRQRIITEGDAAAASLRRSAAQRLPADVAEVVAAILPARGA